MAKFPFTPAQSDEPARWLVERLMTFGKDVLSIVPSGFEAYARVFHPAEKVMYGSEDPMNWAIEPIRWAEVAKFTGRTPHGAMQWPSLCGASPIIHDETVLQRGDVWAREPEMGTLPLSVARALWPMLEQHTTTRDRCFFAIWEGFGGLPKFIHEAPAFEIPARRFYLFEAPLRTIEQSLYTGAGPDDIGSGFGVMILEGETPSVEEVEQALAATLAEGPIVQQSANLWWPEDRAWCVATEIDFNTTYVAGTQGLVDALLACEELEAYQVEPTDGVAYDGDTLNPLPDDPYGGSFRLE